MEQPALCIHRHRIRGFNHPWIDSIEGAAGGRGVIADVYCVVRPMMVTAGLNMYTLFS